jgi:DNA-binding response OmpR family regulator
MPETVLLQEATALPRLSSCTEQLFWRSLQFMARPTFLVAEPEPEQALSARKLVIETAKFNVITAHSNTETRELLRQFPNPTALIIHSQLRGWGGSEFVKGVKQHSPHLPVILLSPLPGETYGTDYQVSSHDPDELVQLLRTLFGDPRQLDTIEAESRTA